MLEAKRLITACEHLVESNVFMVNMLVSEPDPELELAVQENELIIAKYQAKVQELQELITTLGGPACLVAAASGAGAKSGDEGDLGRAGDDDEGGEGGEASGDGLGVYL